MFTLKNRKTIKKKNFNSVYRIPFFLLCLFMLSFTAIADTLPTQLIVDQAVRDYVLHAYSDACIMKTGSWVGNNPKYKDPVTFLKDMSDHDMTLILPPGMDDTKALAEWKNARKTIAGNVRQILMAEGKNGKEIEQVISSISIYPPQQLVGSPKNLEEAKNIFSTIDNGKQLVPCIGKNAVVEGAFGDSAKAFRQFYESKSGKVIYKSGNKVLEGFPDLNHMAEGYGKFKLKGTTSLSEQFVSKTVHAIDDGAAKDCGKNLERAAQYYRKAKSLARVNQRGPIGSELEKLVQSFKDLKPNSYPKWLENNKEKIRKVLLGVKSELGLYAKLADTANPREIKLIMKILSRKTSVWGKLFKTVTYTGQSAMKKIPWGPIIHGLDKMMWAVTTKETIDLWNNEGPTAAANFLSKSVILANLNLPVSLTCLISGAMAEAALDEVETMGINMVTRYQECDQLIAGIHMVKGHESVGEGMDIKELARKYTEKNAVLGFVERQAEKAADRGIKSAVESKTMEKIKKQLLEKCGEQIIFKWRNERNVMIGRLLKLEDDLDGIMSRTIMDLTCREQTVRGKSFVECLPSPTTGRRVILNILTQISDGINALAEEHHAKLLLSESYIWNVDGKKITETNDPSINYDAGGSLFLNPGTETKSFPLGSASRHTIKLTYQLSIKPFLYYPKDLENYRERLKKTYTFTTRFVLNEKEISLKIIGSNDISLGEELNLKGQIIPSRDASGGETFKVNWFNDKNDNKEFLASGMSLQWKPDTTGRYKIKAVLYRNGKWTAEDQFTVRVANAGISREFSALDTKTGNVLENLHVNLASMDGTVQQRDASNSSGKVHFRPLKAGKYIYRCTASGYKDLEGDAIFKESGKIICRMSPIKENQELIPGPMKIQTFKLNHSKVAMGHNENIGLSATIISGKGPYMAVKNVTSEVLWSTDNPEIIVQTDKGVIVSGNKDGTCTIHAHYTSENGENRDAYCQVTVRDHSTSLPLIDFSVSPEKPSYQAGELIAFTQKISTANPQDYYFIWLLDGDKEKRGPSITHIFTQRGKYSVRLVVKSISTGKEDALAKTITVEDEQNLLCGNGFCDKGENCANCLPDCPCSSGEACQPNDSNANAFGCAMKGMDLTVSKLDKYCEDKCGYTDCQCGEEPDPSDCVTVRDDPNTPEDESSFSSGCVALETYNSCMSKCNSDEKITCQILCMHNEKKKIREKANNTTPDNTKNGIIGSHINRFDMKKIPGIPTTEIQSSYWVGGLGHWSEPSSFERISKTKNIILRTGDQSDGYNTGYLVFIPEGKNEIQFRVYHFDFTKHKGIYYYGGTLNLHGKTVDPASLSFIEVHTRAVIVQWKATDASIGRVRISKNKGSESSMVQNGIKEILFVDSGGSKVKQSEKESATPWQEIEPGIEQRFDENWRCELKIAPNVPYILAEMKAVGKNPCIVDKSGSCVINSSENTAMTLGSGYHRLPLLNKKTTYERKIMGYKYYFWSANKEMIGVETAKVGKNTSSHSLDDGMVNNKPDVKIFRYKNSHWPARLKSGELEIQQDKNVHYKWAAEEWITIGNHIDSFEGSGTGGGPIIIYKKQTKWTAVLLHYASGERVKTVTSKKPIFLKNTGRYGAMIKIGEKCYDFSSNNRVRTPEVNCRTLKFTGGELQ